MNAVKCLKTAVIGGKLRQGQVDGLSITEWNAITPAAQSALLGMGMVEKVTEAQALWDRVTALEARIAHLESHSSAGSRMAPTPDTNALRQGISVTFVMEGVTYSGTVTKIMRNKKALLVRAGLDDVEVAFSELVTVGG